MKLPASDNHAGLNYSSCAMACRQGADEVMKSLLRTFGYAIVFGLVTFSIVLFVANADGCRYYFYAKWYQGNSHDHRNPAS